MILSAGNGSLMSRHLLKRISDSYIFQMFAAFPVCLSMKGCIYPFP